MRRVGLMHAEACNDKELYRRSWNEKRERLISFPFDGPEYKLYNFVLMAPKRRLTRMKNSYHPLAHFHID